MNQICSCCKKGIDYDIGIIYLKKLGKASICNFCLEELKDLLELNSLTQEMNYLKSSHETLKGYQEDDVADIEELKERIEELEKVTATK
jgi:DNA-binding transcriptional MerR regulator